MNTLETISQNSIFVLEMLGITAFAVSGVLAALRKRMDIVGICVCGFLTAFGGGTLRDVLIDRRPFFWVDHQYALLSVLAISIACATLFRRGHLRVALARDPLRLDAASRWRRESLSAGIAEDRAAPYNREQIPWGGTV